ncbi:MAG: cbb3-type cytochrome c oxidase subunit I [Rhodospirillales bacterium]
MTGDAPTPFSAFRAAARSEDAGWEVRAWLLLGMTALAIAGVFALFLALSRVPGTENLIPWPLHFFEKGLVIHVVYSFVVWFLCLLGALAAAATYHLDDGRSRGRSTGRSAVWMVAAGQILLMIPAVEHATEASLNNYVPAIIDPLYYLGLVFMFMGVLFVVIRLLAAFLRRANQPGPDGLGILLTTAAYVAAFICFGVTFHAASGEPASAELNERLFWGGGHVLQFVNAGLMLCAWFALASLAGRPLSGNLFFAVMATHTLFSFIGPALYWIFPLFSADQTQAFTDLQYLLSPAPTVLAAAILIQRSGGASSDRPLDGQGRLARHALYLSMGVFFLGGLLGLFVDGTDTRTPAHYHGVIGGVNLGLMGLVFCVLLPSLNRAVNLGRAVTALFWLYGLGQALHSLGLFLAGGYGAPRKVGGDIAGLEAVGAQAGLYGMGVGAVIAVAGGVMFIWIAGRALLRRPIPTDTGPRRELKI